MVPVNNIPRSSAIAPYQHTASAKRPREPVKPWAVQLSPPHILCQEGLVCGGKGLAATSLLCREVKLPGISVHLLISMVGKILLEGSVEALGSARLLQLLQLCTNILQWARRKWELHNSCLRLRCWANTQWPSLVHAAAHLQATSLELLLQQPSSFPTHCHGWFSGSGLHEKFLFVQLCIIIFMEIILSLQFVLVPPNSNSFARKWKR